MARVSAVYRCRHCGAVFRYGEYDSASLNVQYGMIGLHEGELVWPDRMRAAMFSVHTCDGCCPKFGVADLVGWE